MESILVSEYTNVWYKLVQTRSDRWFVQNLQSRVVKHTTYLDLCISINARQAQDAKFQPIPVSAVI
jgi:hypothetical protein